MLLSDNFSMNTKFVDLTELYKLGFHKKIVTQKDLGDQGACHTKIEKFYRRTHFNNIVELCDIFVNNANILSNIRALSTNPLYIIAIKNFD